MRLIEVTDLDDLRFIDDGHAGLVLLLAVILQRVPATLHILVLLLLASSVLLHVNLSVGVALLLRGVLG